MIRLTVGNSLCKITGINTKEYNELRELLSYSEDPAAAFYRKSWKSGKRYLIDKKGNFPTGLLYIVEDYLKLPPEQVYDQRWKPTHLLSLPMQMLQVPYEEQIQAAEAASQHHRGIIVAPTGVGKSLITALIIARLRVRTLVVVPSLELKRQLSQSLFEWFGQDALQHISVQNVDALDPTKKAEVDLVIIDEFHHSGAKTYRMLNQKAWSGVYYKIGLTATPFRSQDHERLLLESVLSRTIYKVDYKSAVSKGYIVPMEAYYVDVPPQAVEGRTWAQVYSQLVVNNVPRNKIINELLSRFYDNNLKTLCLVKEIRHGELLTNISGAGFANGQDGASADLIAGFNAGKLTCLIGTTGVLGEGVDIKPAEYIIIAGLGKSKNAFMQQVGRGFRRHGSKETCKVIIFRDTSHKWTLAHFKEQCKILKSEYGIVPRRLEV